MSVFEVSFALSAVILGLALAHIAAVTHRLLLAGKRVCWAAEPILQLRGLQAGADVLSAQDRAQLRTALQNASTLDYQIRGTIRSSLELARTYGYQPNSSGPGLSTRGAESVCLPMDTPLERAEASLLTPLTE